MLEKLSKLLTSYVQFSKIEHTIWKYIYVKCWLFFYNIVYSVSRSLHDILISWLAYYNIVFRCYRLFAHEDDADIDDEFVAPPGQALGSAAATSPGMKLCFENENFIANNLKLNVLLLKKSSQWLHPAIYTLLHSEISPYCRIKIRRL